VMVLGGGAFGRSLGLGAHDDGATMMGLVPL